MYRRIFVNTAFLRSFSVFTKLRPSFLVGFVLFRIFVKTVKIRNSGFQNYSPLFLSVLQLFPQSYVLFRCVHREADSTPNFVRTGFLFSGSINTRPFLSALRHRLKQLKTADRKERAEALSLWSISPPESGLCQVFQCSVPDVVDLGLLIAKLIAELLCRPSLPQDEHLFDDGQLLLLERFQKSFHILNVESRGF